jgi:hypothetical protein
LEIFPNNIEFFSLLLDGGGPGWGKIILEIQLVDFPYPTPHCEGGAVAPEPAINCLERSAKEGNLSSSCNRAGVPI